MCFNCSMFAQCLLDVCSTCARRLLDGCLMIAWSCKRGISLMLFVSQLRQTWWKSARRSVSRLAVNATTRSSWWRRPSTVECGSLAVFRVIMATSAVPLTCYECWTRSVQGGDVVVSVCPQRHWSVSLRLPAPGTWSFTWPLPTAASKVRLWTMNKGHQSEHIYIIGAFISPSNRSINGQCLLSVNCFIPSSFTQILK